MPNSVHHSPLPTTSEIEENKNTSWWNRRTKLERTLCFVTIITVLIFCVVTVILASTTRNGNSSSTPDGVCMTAGCIKTASAVLEMIDEKTDPCQNFYKFACGGYIEKNEIPDDKPDKTVYSDVDAIQNLKVKVLLNKPLDGSEPKHVQMLKDVYDSCMDLKAIEEANSEPLRKVLNYLGGWPVVKGDSWDERKFDWLNTLIVFRRLGYDPNILLHLTVDLDIQNNNNHVIMIDQTSLGLRGPTLVKGLSDPATAAYFKFMVQAANKLGANEAKSEKELKEALNFEISLADYFMPEEKRRNMSSMYNKYTVRKLQKLVPQVDWLKYFNGLLNDRITEDQTVIVLDPEFVKKFGELLATTNKRTIANYMIWRVVKSSLSYLSKEWRGLELEYNSVVSGESQEPPRWEYCVNSVTSSAGIALSKYYVENFFHEEDKEKAQELVKYLRQEFLNILESTDWMDESTKEKARDKAKAMMSFVGYPQELLDDASVLKLYENVRITDEDYFNYKMSFNRQKTDDSFNKLRKPRVKGDWRDHAMSVVANAFYKFEENSMDVPAAYLQNPFFDKDRPQFMNFGSIGHVIGHEIMHGFDDQGRQFDKDGNIKNWWDVKTDDKFKEKAMCMIYQYGNYTTESGFQMNGIITLGENIADNGGLKEAYSAYHSWVGDHGEEQKLPGLKYTPGQLFWISAAHVRCEKFRTEFIRQEILTNPHSPGEFRVIGPLSNLPEFSKEFQCPPGSPMNPHKKCAVW